MGCDLVQGHYLGMPMAPGELARRLAAAAAAAPVQPA
jgi:hypothetical protein